MHRIDVVAVDGQDMEIFYFPAQGKANGAGVILAQHIPVGHTGVENDTFTLKTAERYAENGYAVAVPFIFHWWPKSAGIEIKREEFRDDWTALDLGVAYDYLAGQAGVAADRIGIIGHCWGGRVAWVGAGHNPKLKACGVFYGGRVRQTMGPDLPPAIDLAASITCPVIGFFGNEDSNPSPEDVDVYEAALRDAGVPVEFHRYDGAGHAFQSFNNPERYHEAASEDAWQKVLDFLSRQLLS